MRKKVINSCTALVNSIKNFFLKLPHKTIIVGSYLLVLLLLFGVYYWRTTSNNFTPFPETPPVAEEAEETTEEEEPDEQVIYSGSPEQYGAEELPSLEVELEGQPLPEEELQAAVAASAAATPPARPLNEWQLIRPFGTYVVEELSTGARVHQLTRGVDLSTVDTAPVAALWDGIVVRIEEKDLFFGKSILLEHEGGSRSFYGNLGEIWVTAGQQVSRGEQLGRLYPAPEKGGDSFLHLQVLQEGKRVDPIDLLEEVARH